MNETFSVRRISYGEGVERIFPLHSPRVDKIEVERQGDVRRAKLTYLRKRLGKGATLVKELEGKVRSGGEIIHRWTSQGRQLSAPPFLSALAVFRAPLPIRAGSCEQVFRRIFCSPPSF